MEDNKQLIIDLFTNNVKGKVIELNNYIKNHNGKEGHWLEKQMNIKHNSNNKPDIYGYEMKKHSTKITFGDFSASEYLFSIKKIYINEMNNWNNDMVNITKDQFIKMFGTQKSKKNNRYSWSGECVPKYNKYNNCGQILIINDENDICIFYSYSKDTRTDIKETFPTYLQDENILIVIWKNEKMRIHINNKYNEKGFFIIKKKNNVFDSICFGNPFNYECFIYGIKNYTVIFDSGLKIGNNRNYSHFRSSNNKFWDNYITEQY